jgi:hypothetical protein
MLIKTVNTDLGYLMLDHRNSPELPPGVRENLLERATYTCTHCCAVVVLNPERKRSRYTCKGCNHMICDGCAAIKEQTGVCKTFAQVVDEVIAQAEKQDEQPLILLQS